MEKKVVEAREPSGSSNVVAEHTRSGPTSPADGSLRPTGRLLNCHFFAEALRNHNQSPMLQKLLIAWLKLKLDAHPKEFDYNIFYAVEAIKRAKLVEAAEYIVAIVQPKNGFSRSLRGHAIVCLGYLGDKKHLPLIESFLEDKTVLTEVITGGKSYCTQMRDVALGMTIAMNGKDPAHFGFERLAQSLPDSGLYVCESFSFTCDENREKAFQLWESQRK